MNAEDYIRDRLDDQMNWYDAKAGKMQKRYKFWQAAKLISALLIPIATLFMEREGVSREGIFCWGVTIASLGALIILIEGIQKLYDYKDLWKKYRMAAEELQTQKIQYQTGTGGYSRSKDPFKLLVARCENIMNEEKKSWDELMDEPDE